MSRRINKKIILPKGFAASGISAKIKRSGRPDLALVFSLGKAKSAALFTANKITAAHIKVCQSHIRKSNFFQGLIVNSGNANCFTGSRGIGTAEEITGLVAMALGLKKEEVLIASTGIIGRQLEINKFKEALPGLVKKLSRNGAGQAAQAILTTDTFVKTAAERIKIKGKEVSLFGFAKGAGMISPDLATMLCFVLTDACISQRLLNAALKAAVADSFNCITVDGCMSTNDTVLALANGCAGNPLIDKKGADFKKFALSLNALCLKLAKMIVIDGEGASKLIKITVSKAKTFKEARMVALGIANSNLFKTAIYGENNNLGRIVAAVGACGIRVKESALKITTSPLNKKKVNLKVALNRGRSQAVIYTSDLTPEYIKINAAYN